MNELRAHVPGVRLLLASPTPLDELSFTKSLNAIDTIDHTRKHSVTLEYASACEQLAKDFQVDAFVNLHTVFDEYIQEQKLTLMDMFVDGLHPNFHGNDAIAQAFSRVLISTFELNHLSPWQLDWKDSINKTD